MSHAAEFFSRNRSKGPSVMTDATIDVPQDATAQLAGLKSRGIMTVFGYISSINPTGGKCWTVARMKAVAAAGMHAGVVHEGWGGVGGKGISAADGARDGAFSVSEMKKLGAPPGACCYFACDQDFSANQIALLVIPYFTAIEKAFVASGYRVGIYGSGNSCMAVLAKKLADKTWIACSTGWGGYKEFVGQADIVQHVSPKISGLDVDTDTCKAGDDVGTFTPFAAASALAPPVPAPAVVPKPTVTSPPLVPSAPLPAEIATSARSFFSRWV
jgi:hypothetical protein